MCFNYKVSLGTFIIGTLFSLLLFKCGNQQFSMENKVAGTFLVFISLVQLMDFFFWIDLKNKYGINKIVTILGPVLNVCQPVILYLIKYAYFTPTLTSPIALLNALYFIYFLFIYARFLSESRLITGTQHGHLKWPWLKYSNPYFYLVLFAINIFYLFDFNYAVVFFSVTYFFLYISYKYFYYSAGELWCFFGSFIPLIMYFASFYIK